MSKQAYILAVDDEAMNREILREALEEEYVIECLADGPSCLAAVKERLPDLILLDVKMSPLTGLEVCRQLREDEDLPHIPIIFVSALGSLEERMAGYQAGGDDYLVKPFAIDELSSKIALLLEYSAQMQQLQQASREARHVAMTALTAAGEMGEILRFLQESLSCNDHRALADLLFATLDNLGLEGILRLGSAGTATFYNRTSIIHPLEKSVLGHCGTDQRVITFGKSAIFSSTQAMLFIRALPIEDEESYGRMKDMLAMLIMGVDARLVELQKSLHLAKREQALAQLLHSIEQTTAEIVASQAKVRNKIVMRFSQMIKEMEQAIDDTIGAGLSLEQEDCLMTIITKAEKDTIALISEEVDLERRLKQIVQGVRWQ
ncbi:response regulator transcription factor [Candidatus Magnetaquicoccus inordinatus]|uniref:response regulator transcription factor n=1 Tax=Candidatus Magnetaquicoccus inordinatus TaxID=2496818 RepID=UPI00187D63C8|nr:response regulator [Candidatus Magnetaquicoccus inordinatus]